MSLLSEHLTIAVIAFSLIVIGAIVARGGPKGVIYLSGF